VILGAAIAFPAGVMFAGREPVPEKASPPVNSGSRAAKPVARNVYSPTIFNDPFVQDQLREMVEALESHCRNQREHCAEAKQSRRWLDQQKTTE
jgi:hypothetical protein